MPRRTRKFRGSRTHGRGKKHGRGAGGRGGTGYAGLHKHKFKWMIKYEPDHFGRHGFVRHAQGTEPETSINLEALVTRLAEFEEKGFASRDGSTVIVDLAKAGYERLLGKGRVSLPMAVTVAHATEAAAAKVAAAGGAVRTPGDKGTG